MANKKLAVVWPVHSVLERCCFKMRGSLRKRTSNKTPKQGTSLLPGFWEDVLSNESLDYLTNALKKRDLGERVLEPVGLCDS